jgi:hypothetical protein
MMHHLNLDGLIPQTKHSISEYFCTDKATILGVSIILAPSRNKLTTRIIKTMAER